MKVVNLNNVEECAEKEVQRSSWFPNEQASPALNLDNDESSVEIGLTSGEIEESLHISETCFLDRLKINNENLVLNEVATCEGEISNWEHQDNRTGTEKEQIKNAEVDSKLGPEDAEVETPNRKGGTSNEEVFTGEKRQKSKKRSRGRPPKTKVHIPNGENEEERIWTVGKSLGLRAEDDSLVVSHLSRSIRLRESHAEQN